MKKLIIILVFLPSLIFGQTKLVWQNVDSSFSPLPSSVHVYYTNSALDTSPFKAYYVVADLKNKKLDFTTDTSQNRRLTPNQFYEKNDQPLVVVNGTFFSFETNRNLNVVIKNGHLASHNVSSFQKKVGDSIVKIQAYKSAIGISKKRKADVAWVKTDSADNKVWASQFPNPGAGKFFLKNTHTGEIHPSNRGFWEKWNVQTAIGGGPSLVFRGEIYITNEYENMFTGKAINDKHPRTAMGYTNDDKLIILVIEGRNKDAGGATLNQEAQILKDLGCVEALNLDGGGSSCLLINGKETIKPSDAKGQRPVPAVFIINRK